MGDLKTHRLPDDSVHLCEEHNREFEKWWNSDLFNWEDASWALVMHCLDYFDVWWNPDRYNWYDFSWTLAKHCNHLFDKWWDPNRYDWHAYSWALAQYCSSHFKKWWNPKQFNSNHYPYLFKHCMDYIDIWLPTVAKNMKIVKYVIENLDPKLLMKLKLILKLKGETDES